jgi:hypothetical protein
VGAWPLLPRLAPLRDGVRPSSGAAGAGHRLTGGYSPASAWPRPAAPERGRTLRENPVNPVKTPSPVCPCIPARTLLH